jgi:hypothetical protein
VTVADRIPIVIRPATEEAKRLWAKALELAEALGPAAEWTLVGGLMVQLYAFEHGDDSRPTTDIDVLGDSRRRPAMTQQIAKAIVERGGEIALPPRSEGDLGYRFEIDGEVVEVLGSEGVKVNPKTIGKFVTFQVPGGTQALQRTEIVLASLEGGPSVQLRRPDLLGAILIKARAVAAKRQKLDSDRQDLIRLLSFVEDPRALATESGLRGTERKWLKSIEKPLAFDDSGLTRLFPAEVLVRVRQAFALLLA